jgi:hypothetical protein
MDSKTLAVIITDVVVVLVLVAALIYQKRRRSENLKERFGPEYDRLVRQHGDPQRVETVLSEREKRVSHLKLRDLPATEQSRYVQRWTFVQKQFVDDPRAAVNEADRLVTDVMNARGYPMSEFAQRADDISVNYPNTVQLSDRSRHRLAPRQRSGQHRGSTQGHGALPFPFR